MTGFDCSGFVVELLQSCGQIKHKSDYTSQGLYDYFDHKGTHSGASSFGALVFYGKSVTRISHVAFGLDSYRVAEYGGGGSATTDAQEAARVNAFGRIRPVDYRSDRVACVKPTYRTIGVL